jgi:uncharacterized protein involved in exopolysaccharide biosynthesis
MLGLLKPDPVTGVGVDSRNAGVFIDTQKELIRDYAVTGPVVDRLGWLTDPNKIAAYQGRPANDTRDFRHWLAQQVADRTNSKLTTGTIYEITFSSTSPVEAKVGAEILRQSYMDYTLMSRRQEAARNAQWYMAQAQSARNLAEQAELAKAQYERENGIVMQGDSGENQQDVDSTRLAALVSQQATAPAAVVQRETGPSPASLQLAAIDAELAQNSQKLGPNHPEMQQLRARRSLVAKVVADEVAAAKSGSSTAAAVGAISRAVQEQKSRVIGQRDKVERLRQLQSEVDLRREQYKKTAERAAELNLEAGVADSGISSLGVVVTPNKAAFPNKPLILGGAFVLGLALGLMLAVLIELLNRRVRGIEDLDISSEFACLAVIGSGAPLRDVRGRPSPGIAGISGAPA